MLTNIDWGFTVSDENAEKIENGLPVVMLDRERADFIQNIRIAMTSTSDLPKLSRTIIELFHREHANKYDIENELDSLDKSPGVTMFGVVLGVPRDDVTGGGRQQQQTKGLEVVGKRIALERKPPPTYTTVLLPQTRPGTALPYSVTKMWENPRMKEKDTPKQNPTIPPALKAYAFDSYSLNTYLLLQSLVFENDNLYLDKLGKEAVYNYNAINRERINDISEFIEKLSYGFDQYATFQENRKVFRGQPLPFIATTEDAFMATPENPVKFRCPSYVSTTVAQDTARRFVYNICCVMVLDVGPGVRAVDMNRFVDHALSHEQEYLFDRGYIIEVYGVKYDGDVKRFVMRSKIVVESDYETTRFLPAMETIRSFNGTNTTGKITGTSTLTSPFADSDDSGCNDVRSSTTLIRYNQSLRNQPVVLYPLHEGLHKKRYDSYSSSSSSFDVGASSGLPRIQMFSRGVGNRRYSSSDGSSVGGGARSQCFVSALLGLAVVVIAMVPR